MESGPCRPGKFHHASSEAQAHWKQVGIDSTIVGKRPVLNQDVKHTKPVLPNRRIHLQWWLLLFILVQDTRLARALKLKRS